MRSLTLTFVALLAAGVVAHAGGLVVRGNGRTATVDTVMRNGAAFVRVEELFHALGYAVSAPHAIASRGARRDVHIVRFDVTTAAPSARITIELQAGTPFARAGSASSMQVFQLPKEPLRAVEDGGDAWRVPLRGFVELLRRAGLDIAVAQGPPVLVSQPPSKKVPAPPVALLKPGVRPDTLTGITIEERANGYRIRLATTGLHGAPVVRTSDEHEAEAVLPRMVSRERVARDLGPLEGTGHVDMVNGDSGLVLRVTVDAPIEGTSVVREKGGVSLLLRTSRETKRAPEKGGKWAMDVIVLDAGHGGKDPGAQGVGGTNEKDVTLGIVLKLGALLEEAGYKVVYTRRDDRFIELDRRGQIANEAKGKLFISIHCNSMPTKPNPAHGFESYILRPGKTESAVRVASRENNVIRFEKNTQRYGDLSDAQFIVAAMAQSAFVKTSEKFAARVQDELAKRLPGSRNNGVSQAGFLVLVGASMPNILIETGYISNTREEQVLASEEGQRKIAAGIAAAVKRLVADGRKGDEARASTEDVAR